MVGISQSLFLDYHRRYFAVLIAPLPRAGFEREVLLLSFSEFEAAAKECLGQTVTQEGINALYAKVAQNKWLVTLNRRFAGLQPKHKAHST